MDLSDASGGKSWCFNNRSFCFEHGHPNVSHSSLLGANSWLPVEGGCRRTSCQAPHRLRRCPFFYARRQTMSCGQSLLKRTNTTLSRSIKSWVVCLRLWRHFSNLHFWCKSRCWRFFRQCPSTWAVGIIMDWRRRRTFLAVSGPSEYITHSLNSSCSRGAFVLHADLPRLSCLLVWTEYQGSCRLRSVVNWKVQQGQSLLD